MKADYLETRKAARCLGICHRTLEKFRIYGAGPPYIRIGQRIVYKHDDLVKWQRLRRLTASRNSNSTALARSVEHPNDPPLS